MGIFERFRLQCYYDYEVRLCGTAYKVAGSIPGRNSGSDRDVCWLPNNTVWLNIESLPRGGSGCTRRGRNTADADV